MGIFLIIVTNSDLTLNIQHCTLEHLFNYSWFYLVRGWGGGVQPDYFVLF